MNGKKIIGLTMTLMAAAVALVAALAWGEGAVQVSAAIGQDCQSRPTTFVVSDGKTAYNFTLAKLEPGSACHGDATPPENKGFSIRDGKNRQVYTWSQYQTQTPYEKGGPLKSLSLIPGSYTLSVAGGAGAMVELSYQIK